MTFDEAAEVFERKFKEELVEIKMTNKKTTEKKSKTPKPDVIELLTEVNGVKIVVGTVCWISRDRSTIGAKNYRETPFDAIKAKLVEVADTYLDFEGTGDVIYSVVRSDAEVNVFSDHKEAQKIISETNAELRLSFAQSDYRRALLVLVAVSDDKDAFAAALTQASSVDTKTFAAALGHVGGFAGGPENAKRMVKEMRGKVSDEHRTLTRKVADAQVKDLYARFGEAVKGKEVEREAKRLAREEKAKASAVAKSAKVDAREQKKAAKKAATKKAS